MNVTFAKAKLMTIHIGLIPAIANNNIYNITVVTNSITATSKILESHINLFQNIIILLAFKIKSFLSKDNRNAIYFWYCLSKVKLPRYKLINDQIKATDSTSTLPSKNSFLFRKKKECDNILKE